MKDSFKGALNTLINTANIYIETIKVQKAPWLFEIKEEQYNSILKEFNSCVECLERLRNVFKESESK